jgi:hypothetical protein
LRISLDASAAADDAIASDASEVNSSPSAQCAYTSLHSFRRVSRARVVHVERRPLCQVTSTATSKPCVGSSPPPTLDDDDDVARLESALKARREEEEEKRSSWAKKLKNTEEATREVDWEKIRDEETRAAALAVRKAAGVAGAAGARRGPLDDALADAIAMTNDANFLADEFDVGVSFKPALVDAQHSMLRIRAPSSSSSRVGGGEEPTHGLEVAVDVTWHSGRRSTWTTRSRPTPPR